VLLFLTAFSLNVPSCILGDGLLIIVTLGPFYIFPCFSLSPYKSPIGETGRRRGGFILNPIFLVLSLLMVSLYQGVIRNETCKEYEECGSLTWI
jgi:hypothetical protein